MQKQRKYSIIGLMSGTSLDGLDIAACTFTDKGGKLKFDIEAASTIKYGNSLVKKLASAIHMSAEQLWQLHSDFGAFCGKEVKKFVAQHHLQPLMISSHGHTVFHKPQKGFTCQIGSGAHIAAYSGINTVCDFRSTDVALGGQGAPLVPIGDALLFEQYDACLNIGGIANISFREGKRIRAFDICGANILLNHYASLKGKKFDNEGKMARKGKVYVDQLSKLIKETNSLKKASIGREWIDKKLFPILEKSQLSTEDKLATSLEYCAMQIGSVLEKNKIKKLLVTGGGTYNDYLLERIAIHSRCKLVIPDKKIIEFKEAVIFAFLGYLRVTEQTNCLNSVTGASKDNIGGCVYLA